MEQVPSRVDDASHQHGTAVYLRPGALELGEQLHPSLRINPASRVQVDLVGGQGDPRVVNLSDVSCSVLDSRRAVRGHAIENF